MENRWQIRCALAVLGALLVAANAAAEKTVAEEILDVLRAQGAISEGQYDDWTQRARDEKAAWAGAAAPEPSAPDGGRKPLVSWKDGLRFHPSDEVELKLGGRVYADYAYFAADDATVAFFDEGELDGGSGMEFSRARLFVSGLLYDLAEFKAQWDFATGEVRARDLYLGLRGLPWVGNVRAGHFKEPYTLQRLTSSKHIQFMERSMMNTFATDRNMGVMLFDSVLADRMTWALGGFLETDETGFAFSDGGNHNLTGRVTGLVFDRDEGRQLLHLGFSYVHRFVGDEIRFRSKPEARLSPVEFVDTGLFTADHVDQITPELALNWGPFSLQSEYTLALVDAPASGDPTFDGFYVQAGWFLTGEHRPYDRKRGFFGKVRPRRNFDLRGGLGAWQLGVRYSWVDLADGAFSELDFENRRGRRLDDVTVGLNWYLNPYMRIMLNYVHADLDDVGDTNIFQSRMQFDF